MELRPGIPAVVLAHLGRHGRLPRTASFLSLPEWLVAGGGRATGIAHVSIAAASGLYDIGAQRWSERILRAVGAEHLGLNRVCAGTQDPIGSIDVRGKPVPVFGGIGDMQTAMVGAGLPARSMMAINIGTGSQVGRVLRQRSGLSGERRPFFGDTLLAATTHIPAGRALNVFSQLVDGFTVPAGGRDGRFWEMLGSLAPEAILSAPHTVDLNLFSSAWRFRDGGSIAGLLERNCSAEQLVASIARAWLSQYGDAVQGLDPDRQTPNVALAGGLARRVPACVPVLAKLLGREVLPPADDEETLCGLAALARGLAA
jgi:xylulokinase